MIRKATGWLAVALAALLSAACHPDRDVRPADEEVPGTVVPGNFPAPVYTPPIATTPASFALGRQLFYDARLSRDGSVSCGSCHQQFAAFAHAGHTLSHGIDGRLGTRNAPALQNLRWGRSFMWDGGVSNLEIIPLAPINNPLEMDETLENVLRKLNADAGYRQRFAAVYGEGPINAQQFLRALAQFTAALTSANSRYDHYARGEAGGTLTTDELRGLALVRQRCSGCHATDLFTDETYRNNGLNRTFAADSGRVHITGRPAERGLFKVPSLRNVALTAPYMHDGRFQTLAEVLAHYDHGVQDSPTLDAQLRQPGGRLGIPLTAQEQADIQAFLLTLTDHDFINDKRLAERQ
ncbi:cytochrome-c peroxidase [Hymenobacter busanensis]|uniref:Cytochrome-c peroxidase n=2 Tax=Hymenobacter busanensis TaxID=2607656 RepID=A0A7L5A2T8_9BACT|nr:cytochrome-c peroxidase [Hymenobacter busanensis]QHJ09637.1 cytochrome-c peroxidase [Hymenobacter busanensis]